MSMSSFSAFALTRSEMKNIVGGTINCTCDYGSGVQVTGECSGATVAACQSYSCSGGGTLTSCEETGGK